MSELFKCVTLKSIFVIFRYADLLSSYLESKEYILFNWHALVCSHSYFHPYIDVAFT